MYALAQPLLEKALEITRRILTDYHSDTATNYNNLANNLNAQGMYALAQPLHERALEIRRRLLTDDHLLTTKSYNDLGVNLNAQGKYAEAQGNFEKALEINLRILTEDHERTALAYSNLGENLGAQGKFSDAQPFLTKALEIRRRLHPGGHPKTAESCNILASNLDSQGEFARAERLHEQSLEMFRRFLSDDHPDTIRAYIGLAKNLNAQGRYPEAQDHLQHAVKGLDKARLRIAFAGLERTGNLPSPRSDLAANLARLDQPDKAWATLEEDLGRGLLDELAAREDHRLAPEERARFRDLTSELDQLERLMAAYPKGLDEAESAKRFEDLKHQHELASIALGELQTKVVQQHGELEGRVAGLEEIQAALPTDAALVAWVDITPESPKAADPDGEHWGVVVRSKGHPSWIPIAGTDPHGLWSQDDTELAGRVRDELRRRPSGDLAGLQALLERLRIQRLEPLTRVLDANDKGLLKAQRLIILPSRAMAAIPVEALLANDDPRSVSYAPSASVFKQLRERNRPDRVAGLLAVGAPAFEQPDQQMDPAPPDHGLLVTRVMPGSVAASHGLKPGDVLCSYNGTALHKSEDLKPVPEPSRPVPVEIWRIGKAYRLLLDAGEFGVVLDPRPAPLAIVEESKMRQVLAAARSGDGPFPPLPGARVEIEALDQLFRSDARASRLLLGPDASEPELDRMAASGELGRFGVIHLATHGAINERFPAIRGDPDAGRIARPTGTAPEPQAGLRRPAHGPRDPAKLGSERRVGDALGVRDRPGPRCRRRGVRRVHPGAVDVRRGASACRSGRWTTAPPRS